jgi:hypothetical protein
MDDSFIARLGYDPVRIHTRIHGRKPGGIIVNWADGSQTRPPDMPKPSPVEVKAEADDPPPPGEGDHPQDGGGAPSDGPDADGAGRAFGAAEDAVLDGGDSAVPPVPLHHASQGPPPHAGEDAEPHQLVVAWVEAHWDTVMALARAGIAPRMPAASPAAGEPAQAVVPPLPPIHVKKGDRWDRPKMTDFLRQLAATHSVSAAAKSVGMSRVSAYRLRNRLKGQPFDIAWEAAFRQGYDNLAHAALDRAVNGVEVPHYCNGELVGTSRKFDERLTVAMLAMRNRYGAPLMGRYGAAAEWWSERWDAMLQRVETGSIDWQDEQRALGEPLDEDKHVAALMDKHAPDDGPVTPRRR